VRQPIYGLEFLRGLCAIAVALYHCLAWGGFTTLYNWGLYGVYVFFVISGAVLYYNYRDLQDAGPFLLKRFARIAPLYLLCLVLTMIGKGMAPGWSHVLNVLPTFGFSNPGATGQVAGGWSIGIEFALYALFPALLVFTRSIQSILLTCAVLLVTRMATVELSVGDSLDDSWAGYTQLGSFLFFFFAGMAIPRLVENVKINWLFYAVGIITTCALLVVPMDEPILKGVMGVVYSLLCVSVVAFFYFIKLPGSELLGKISYGLYLLHPIVWLGFKRLNVPVEYAMALTIPCASIAALLILRFYELPVKRWILGVDKRAPHGQAAAP
jgi:peptidoglycan/LPS O-acetylase OafA/YrhL